jgi:hypothetical protein
VLTSEMDGDVCAWKVRFAVSIEPEKTCDDDVAVVVTGTSSGEKG